MPTSLEKAEALESLVVSLKKVVEVFSADIEKDLPQVSSVMGRAMGMEVLHHLLNNIEQQAKYWKEITLMEQKTLEEGD